MAATIANNLGDKLESMTVMQAKSLAEYLENAYGIRPAVGGGVVLNPVSSKTDSDVQNDGPGLTHSSILQTLASQIQQLAMQPIPPSFRLAAEADFESAVDIAKSFGKQDWMLRGECCGPWRIQVSPRLEEYLGYQAWADGDPVPLIVDLPVNPARPTVSLQKFVFVMTYPSGAARSLWSSIREAPGNAELVLEDALAILDPDEKLAATRLVTPAPRWLIGIRCPEQEDADAD